MLILMDYRKRLSVIPTPTNPLIQLEQFVNEESDLILRQVNKLSNL